MPRTAYIDKAIKRAVESGFGVGFKFSSSKERGPVVSYTLSCKDGCAYGNCLKLSDFENPDHSILPSGTAYMIAYAIEKSLGFIPDMEAKKEKHERFNGSEVFLA